jgi:hypothetical protein
VKRDTEGGQTLGGAERGPGSGERGKTGDPERWGRRGTDGDSHRKRERLTQLQRERYPKIIRNTETQKGIETGWEPPRALKPDSPKRHPESNRTDHCTEMGESNPNPGRDPRVWRRQGDVQP